MVIWIRSCLIHHTFFFNSVCSIHMNTGFGQDLAKPLQQQIQLLQDGLRHPGLDQVSNQ